jgi:hypothetical protein
MRMMDTRCSLYNPAAQEIAGQRNDTTIEKRAMKQIQPKDITGVVNLDKI